MADEIDVLDSGATSADPRFCTQCGAARNETARFCQECGTPVTTGSDTGAAIPRPDPAPQYLQPAPAYYGPPAAARQSVNGFAIASMVLGIIWIYWVGSILALVFGYIARKQIAESGGKEGGGGMATAGIVLGWIGVGIAIALIVLSAVVAAAGSGTS
jgi:hypothetical protein